ncbi:heterokaryon incompatibility [Fusarium albosuccineum]|uniref:Heterokaryon incompatibility n=1 Tax=Fusarium albosuccineum TaxID=1237068 RepID=A0A8H4KMG7_9HYPO|nr:heterokaryon incompatibility [Fusarium albosuccineum]
MKTYTYSPLKNPQRDIRLVELRPGSRDDDIRVRISHAALEPLPEQKDQTAINLEKLQSSLPPDWTVRKTYEGRYLFRNTQGGRDVSTWEHPDPKFGYSSHRHGTAHDVAAQQTLVFEALSYVWGSPVDPEDILVEVTSQPTSYEILSVGQNLAKALRHLRQEVTTRILWIDALCINQRDIPEREAQVLRMEDIYSLASRVVVWLGPETETTAEAINTLRYLGQQVEYLPDIRYLAPSPEATEPKWYDHSCDLPYGVDTCSAIVELLRREWFERVWVLQEVMLATSRASMQCGNHHISWPLFAKAIVCLWDKHKLPSQDLWGRISHVVDMIWIDHTTNPISQFLSIFLSRKATDPRDKVYGLLGLFPPGFRRRINPQYSAPVVKVYTDTVVAHIAHTKRLDMVQICGLGMPGINRPSWVQDFGSRHIMTRDLRYQLAALSSPCHTSFLAPDKLEVTGVTVGHLGNIGSKNRMPKLDSNLSNASYDNMLHAIREAVPSRLDESTPYLTGESFREAYARTLVANQLRSRIPDLERLDTPETWILQQSVNALFGDAAVDGSSDPSSLSVTERTALEFLSGRTLAETDEGHVGLCPGDAQQGDIVVVLLGCQSPMLLRSQPGGYFKIVGECYMHGVCDGTALLGPLPKPWIVQIPAGRSGLFDEYCFKNTETDQVTREDPRMGPLPAEWERLEVGRSSSDDPEFCERFRNVVSGEVQNSDPRLDLEILQTRVGPAEYILV